MDKNEMIVERPIVQPDSERAIVEKRLVTRRDRTVPLAILIVVTFLASYAMLMAGDRLGVRANAKPPVSTAEVPPPPAPISPN